MARLPFKKEIKVLPFVPETVPLSFRPEPPPETSRMSFRPEPPSAPLITTPERPTRWEETEAIGVVPPDPWGTSDILKSIREESKGLPPIQERPPARKPLVPWVSMPEATLEQEKALRAHIGAQIGRASCRERV